MGAILVNSKKTRTFTIENCGNYEFKYLVAKYVPHSELEALAKEKQATLPAALRRGYVLGINVTIVFSMYFRTLIISYS